jgi:sialate O-acetylesterase
LRREYSRRIFAFQEQIIFIKKQLFVSALALSCAAFSAAAARADVKLHPLFTNNMVVQRNVAIPVYGTARPGEAVRVLAGFSLARAVADAKGNWEVKLPARQVGPAFQISVKGDNSITLSNIVAGDAWIGSGQSNMQWPVAASDNAAQEIASANHPTLRLFSLPRISADAPQDAVTSGPWQVSSPQAVPDFSAVSYFFGRELNAKTGVPIGLIHTSWGGTVAEAWTSRTALQADAELRSLMGSFTPSTGTTPVSFTDSPNRSTVLFNAMIAPLVRFPVRGAIWYQGESNASRAYQYRRLLPAMIRDWRAHWKQSGSGDFPFYIVELANFQPRAAQPGDNEWAELREAQQMTARNVPNSDIATVIDIGDAADIHPKNKQEVGRRLALIALAKNYGRNDLEYSGPRYSSMKVEGDTIRLNFSHAAGLQMKSDEPSFAIAGADRKLVWAKARIEGQSVVLSSPEVKNPVAARYAWATNPATPLYNAANLPALPFRTDSWPGITVNNK